MSISGGCLRGGWDVGELGTSGKVEGSERLRFRFCWNWHQRGTAKSEGDLTGLMVRACGLETSAEEWALGASNLK